jgi:hypothetical protein
MRVDDKALVGVPQQIELLLWMRDLLNGRAGAQKCGVLRIGRRGYLERHMAVACEAGDGR